MLLTIQIHNSSQNKHLLLHSFRLLKQFRVRKLHQYAEEPHSLGMQWPTLGTILKVDEMVVVVKGTVVEEEVERTITITNIIKLGVIFKVVIVVCYTWFQFIWGKELITLNYFLSCLKLLNIPDVKNFSIFNVQINRYIKRNF